MVNEGERGLLVLPQARVRSNASQWYCACKQYWHPVLFELSSINMHAICARIRSGYFRARVCNTSLDAVFSTTEVASSILHCVFFAPS